MKLSNSQFAGIFCYLLILSSSEIEGLWSTVFLVVVVAADRRWLYRECSHSVMSDCQAPEIKHARSAGCTTTSRFVLCWHHCYLNFYLSRKLCSFFFCFCVWYFRQQNRKDQLSPRFVRGVKDLYTWRELGARKVFSMNSGFSSEGT